MPPGAAPVSPTCDHNRYVPVPPLSEAVVPFPPPLRTTPLPPPQGWEYLRLGLVSGKVSGLSTATARQARHNFVPAEAARPRGRALGAGGQES